MVDAEDSIGPLWIRRQVFEHSVAVPLLTASTASQIDFPRLAAELVAASVLPSTSPPAVTYDAWVAAAGLHARLDSSEHAGIIIEALETNAPDAFYRCNDPAKLEAGRQLPYRQLLIPVPELLAFIKLHAAATVSSRFRQMADAVWPEPDNPNLSTSPAPQPNSRHPSSTAVHSPSHPHLTPLSLTPSSPRLHTTVQTSPSTTPSRPSPSASNNPPTAQSPQTSASQGNQPASNFSQPHSPAPAHSPNFDALMRKKSPSHAMMNSQSAIIASAQHAFERETRLVVSNLKSLLLIVASAYGVGLDASGHSDVVSPETGIIMGSGTVAVESGSLSRDELLDKVRRSQPMSGTTGSDAVMSDENSKASSKNPAITRQMFEHLTFLLTTTCDTSGGYRPVSWVVPQWRDASSTTTVQLSELVEVLTAALNRIPLQEIGDGSTDVTEIRDMDRRTIIRSTIAKTNVANSKYVHAPEVRISNCNDSHFYLLCSLGRVSFIECQGCTLFVGGCVSVSLINCRNVRVHAITRVCRVTNSFDTHLYLCTNRFSQIVGENRGLVFAPYNAAYPKEEIEKHLAAVGVDPSCNVWDKFYRPTYRVSSQDRRDPELTAVVASVLQCDRFLPFAVPVRKIEKSKVGDTSSSKEKESGSKEKDAVSQALFCIAVPLPAGYEEQLKQKSLEIAQFRQEIRSLAEGATKKRGSENEEGGVVDGGGSGKNGGDDSGSGDKGGGGDGGDGNGNGGTDGGTAGGGGRGGDVTMTEDENESGAEKKNKEGEVKWAGYTKRGIQALVQEKFREWLNHSGRIRQLSDLVRLEHESS